MMIRYDKPIIKTAAEMKPGDIFRTEYGDYGNWCEFVLKAAMHTFSMRRKYTSIEKEIRKAKRATV